MPREQLLVLFAPRVAAAVERVAVALHAGLVAVIDAGEAGQRVLHGGGDLQQPDAVGALLGAELLMRLPAAVASVERLACQHGQNALGVVGGE